MDRRQARENALQRHVARIERRMAALKAQSDRLVPLRLMAFIGWAAVVFAGFQISNAAAGAAFIVAAIPFVIAVRTHNVVQNTLQRLDMLRALKQMYLARLRLDWAALPPPEATKAPRDHPFALDLDIVGERGLHQLLDSTVTLGGSKRLLKWLLDNQPDAEMVAARQALVTELKPLTALRDRLALAARLAVASRREPSRMDFSGLTKWLAQPGTAPDRGLMLGLIGLGVADIVLFILFSAGVLPPLWAGVFLVYGLLYGWQWRQLGSLFDEALTLSAALRRLRAVMRELERYDFGARERLKQLCAPVQGEHRPSRLLRQVSWIAAAASLQRSPIVWLMINLIVPWDLFFADRLARSRADLAAHAPRWLETLHELEALNALAAFAYLNPDAVVPKIEADAVLFDGSGLGHPLIPSATKVTNDFRLDEAGQLIILTGSNMSGKSSFLRTMGVNLRLAYAGSVVDANALRIGLFRVYTSIRVSDSLADGFSYFYAEVRRLKGLLDARQSDGSPLFYLIDEIFRGTNNRERLLGSRSYLRSLVGGRGMGVVATHDLELIQLADESPLIANYHFREDVVDGEIVFDYRLHEGPSPTTNALKIMALAGLPVDEADL